MYTLEAYWPNARVDPLHRETGMLEAAISEALRLMRSGDYTTITVRTPDRLELVRLWGQPPSPGEVWP